MELLNQFGFDPKLLFAQIINFLVVLWVLKRFLYKPLLQTLKKRQETIQEGLNRAEKARILLEEIEKKEQKILQNAQKRAQQIIEESQNEGAEIRRQAEESAKKNAERIINEAKLKIEQDTKETEKRLTDHVSKIAIDYLQKAVSQLFDVKSQKEIMEKAMKVIKPQPKADYYE